MGSQYRRKRFISLSSIVFFFCITQVVYSQKKGRSINEILIGDSVANLYNTKRGLNQNSISIQVSGAALSKANIQTKEGYYHLNSRLHSSFSAGMNYTINLNQEWGIYSGLHFNLTRSSFFKNIPNADLTGISRADDAPPLIYYKGIYNRLVVPVMAIRKFKFRKSGFWDIQGGIKLNYSGFSSDEGIGMSIADSNFQFTTIFDGEFKSNNNGKPWVSFSLGASKNLYLKNYNQLRIQLFAEFSKTSFLKGDYQITIPNKPITIGTYSVTGSCVGLSVEYIFTGANKRFIKQYEKKRNL